MTCCAVEIVPIYIYEYSISELYGKEENNNENYAVEITV